MIIKAPSCPYCNEELEADRISHNDELINCEYSDLMEGRCNKCGHVFHWYEIFIFNRYWGFEEETGTNSIFDK